MNYSLEFPFQYPSFADKKSLVELEKLDFDIFYYKGNPHDQQNKIAFYTIDLQNSILRKSHLNHIYTVKFYDGTNNYSSKHSHCLYADDIIISSPSKTNLDFG